MTAWRAQTLCGDVPDDICYAWAEEYFRNSDIKEDQGKEDVYVPLPRPAASQRAKKKDTSRDKPGGDSGDSEKRISEKEPESSPEKTDENVQLSLFDMGPEKEVKIEK